MFGLRQKLFFSFGGLLTLLLAVSILGVAVLQQHRTWLDKFLYENWRSVEYGQHMLDALLPLNTVAQAVSGEGGQPTKAEIAAATAASAKPLADFDANCDAENHNITLPHEDEIASDLTRLWSGYAIDTHTGQTTSKLTDDDYRDKLAKLLSDQTSLSDRRAAYASVARISSLLKTRPGRDRSQFQKHAARGRQDQGHVRQRHAADYPPGGHGRSAGGGFHPVDEPGNSPAAGHAHAVA